MTERIMAEQVQDLIERIHNERDAIGELHTEYNLYWAATEAEFMLSTLASQTETDEKRIASLEAEVERLSYVKVNEGFANDRLRREIERLRGLLDSIDSTLTEGEDGKRTSDERISKMLRSESALIVSLGKVVTIARTALRDKQTPESEVKSDG